jgi:hypothetical protein
MVAAGGLLGLSLQRESHLRADVSNDTDFDQDGLVDAQEVILGTSLTNADTDHDGYSDLEELARKTLPTAAQFHPDNEQDNSISLGMTCHWSNGMIHALMAVYLPDGELHDKTFRVGVMIGHRIRLIPEHTLLARGRMEMYPAHAAGAAIAVIDVPFSPAIVHTGGHVTVFATAGNKGAGARTADVAQLFDLAGVVVYAKVDHSPIVYFSHVSTGQQHPSSANVIYVPLGEDGGPVNWTPGAVCYQQTQVVGTSGASITEEVVSAECTEGWDGSCPPSCPDSVGTTYSTIDPLLLLGG